MNPKKKAFTDVSAEKKPKPLGAKGNATTRAKVPRIDVITSHMMQDDHIISTLLGRTLIA